MYFETAGIEVSPIVPPLVALVISTFTSMGGVSGAFLLLPDQVSVFGFTGPAVSATNQLYNVVAIPSGVIRYIREGRMVWPLTWAVVIGTLPGVFIGALLRLAYLPDARRFKLFAALVLLYLGAGMLRALLGRQRRTSPLSAAERSFEQLSGRLRERRGRRGKTTERPLPTVRAARWSCSTIAYEFSGEAFRAPALGIVGLSLAVGIVGGVYGIGGGAIIAPFFVSYFRLPVFTVAGAALMGTLVTSVAGVVFYVALAPLHPGLSVSPDWLLGLLFGAGGMAGMYLGARLQKYVPAKAIKGILAGIILLTAAKYVWDWLGS